MVRWARAVLVLTFLLCSAAAGRSLVAITTWPSFRLGNDIGRFDWYFDVRWAGVSYWGEYGDSTFQQTYLDFEPSVGCNVALYDSLFTAYVGGALGSLLEFEDGAYSDRVNITLLLGGGIEWPLTAKLSIIGEYMLACGLTFFPETSSQLQYNTGLNLYSRPSLQLRYYIGPTR